jgi:uncharacterized membrane protein
MAENTLTGDRWMEDSMTRILLVLGAGLALGVGCAPSPNGGNSEVGGGQSGAAPRVAEAALATLRDSEYRGIFEEPVRLTDGRYRGPPFVPGGASRPELDLLPDLTVAGDLDGDGEDELVTLLARSEGGSGTFFYLAVMRQGERGLSNVETVELGDRVQLSSLEVFDGILVAGLRTHGPTDAACCPTQQEWRNWQWYGDQLRKVTVLRGHLIYGHEARELKPCTEEPSYWVQDGTQGDLPEVYGNLAVSPYQPVFVEVRGLLIPEKGPGFAEAYNSQIRVTELIRAAREGPGCEEDLKGVRFRATGVEPFWSLDITGKVMELRRLGISAMSFEIETTSESAGVLRLSGLSGEGSALTVELRQGRCTDPMSGEVFPLQSELTVDGEELRGCARSGGLR